MPQKPTTKSVLRSKIKDLKLDALLEVTKAINLNAKEEELFDIFTSLLQGSLDIAKLVMFVKNNDTFLWRNKLQFGVEHIDFSTLDVEGQLSHIKDITVIELSDEKQREVFDILIPVYHKDLALAYILLGDENPDQMAISPIIKHLPFIQTLANLILVAIENKRLAKENIEKQVLSRELEMASKMQKMLLPSHVPMNKHYEVDVFYRPLSEIGGDIYDYIKINNHESVFCLADVSGKGVAAALLMANFIANLRALVSVNKNLEEIVHALNDKVVENAGGERFVTLFIGKYNAKTQSISYINAAHNPPFLSTDGKIEPLEKGCVGIGMLDQIPKVETGELNIKPSSILVAYTDGITDTYNDQDDDFGEERLKNIIQNNQESSMQILNADILKQLDVHRQNQEYIDDIALMSIRFLNSV